MAKRLQNRGSHTRTHNKMTISCFRTCITQIEDDYDFEINGKRSVKIAIIVQAKWHMHRIMCRCCRSPWLFHVHVDSDENIIEKSYAKYLIRRREEKALSDTHSEWNVCALQSIDLKISVQPHTQEWHALHACSWHKHVCCVVSTHQLGFFFLFSFSLPFSIFFPLAFKLFNWKTKCWNYKLFHRSCSCSVFSVHFFYRRQRLR